MGVSINDKAPPFCREYHLDLAHYYQALSEFYRQLAQHVKSRPTMQ